MSLPFPLADVQKVIAYKRDEITTDLICFDVTTDSNGKIQTWFFHEDQPDFDEVARELAVLPGFLRGWREQVVNPPFAPSQTVLYSRPIS